MSKMDDRYIAENDVIKRYLKDKLTPEETIRFEEYILDKPELLEQLVVDAVLVENYSIALDEVKNSEKESKFDWRKFWHIPVATCVITSFAAVFVVIWLNTTGMVASNISKTELIYIDTMRSANTEIQKIELEKVNGVNSYILIFDVDTQNIIYDVVLRNSQNKVLSEVEIHPDVNSQVIFNLVTDNLRDGQYTLRLKPKNNNTLSKNLIIELLSRHAGNYDE